MNKLAGLLSCVAAVAASPVYDDWVVLWKTSRLSNMVLLSEYCFGYTHSEEESVGAFSLKLRAKGAKETWPTDLVLLLFDETNLPKNPSEMGLVEMIMKAKKPSDHLSETEWLDSYTVKWTEVESDGQTVGLWTMKTSDIFQDSNPQNWFLVAASDKPFVVDYDVEVHGWGLYYNDDGPKGCYNRYPGAAAKIETLTNVVTIFGVVAALLMMVLWLICLKNKHITRKSFAPPSASEVSDDMQA